MKLRQPLTRGSSVGLEITPGVIRAVEIEAQARGTIIQRLAHVAVPPGSVQDGRIVDPEAVAGALRQLWEQERFSTRRCGVAVPVGMLAPHMLMLPPAPPAELRPIVGGELSRFTLVESSTPFGWITMASGGGPGGSTLAFLADAAMIAGYRQALSLAGLELDACEPDAVAALRTVELALRQPGGAAAVYVSPTCSEMAFLEAGRIRYYRRLDLGLGGPADGSASGRLLAEGDDPGLARALARGGAAATPAGALSDLALEIKRSLQYYGRAYGSAPQPQKILLLGDSPALEQLAETIHADLQMEAEYLHPVHLYAHAPKITDQHLLASGGHYSAALGMALRPLVDPQAALALDLRASAEAHTLARCAPRHLMAALAGSTAAIVVALAAFLLLTARQSLVRGELRAAQARVRAADTERATTVAQSQQIRMATDRLRRQAMPVPQLLVRLSDLLPDSLALTQLELKEDGSLSLQGEARTPRQVDRFLQHLADDPRLRSPELDMLDNDSRAGLARFTVLTGLIGCGKTGGKRS